MTENAETRAHQPRPASDAEWEARDAGAGTASVFIRAQLEAGVPMHRVEQSAEQAFTAWFENPTAVSRAFCLGYTQVAQAYADAAGEFDLDSDLERAEP